MIRKLELLAPARDKIVALAAIRNGADAVYIGGPGFGARKAAGNSLEEIRQVLEEAHRYDVRVYVTVNTILFDHELAEAERLIRDLYRLETDAVIIQDPAMLRLDIPPIPLHASTQMHNYDIERIRFLDRLGFRRIVLARELSLEQIREIRQAVQAELECFVHGALCVSLSGQCYLSHHLFGRSANRGVCAQPCRLPWNLTDTNGKVWLKNRHLLSLKDLNLSDHLDGLAAAGVDSFKIEGRLKDPAYVANVSCYYSGLLDHLVETGEEYRRASSGKVYPGFVADPEKSFNRGFTTYFLNGRSRRLVNMDTPKSMGKAIGEVVRSQGCQLWVKTKEPLHNGDGLCYLEDGTLKGLRINKAEGEKLSCQEKAEIRPGTPLFRNHDQLFEHRIEKEGSKRKIRISIEASGSGGHLLLKIKDEDGITVSLKSEEAFETAERPEQAERIIRQLQKCGETIFECEAAGWQGEQVLFIPAARINHFRRELLEKLETLRKSRRECPEQSPFDREVPYPGNPDWRLNVVNRLSRQFYRDHGAGEVPPGFETGITPDGKPLMRTRYCLLYEMGKCLKANPDPALKLPLYITNKSGRLRLAFDCKDCFMEVYSE